MEKLNRRPFKKLPGSRLSQYETLDRPALQPLPATPYQYAQWKKPRVHIDYHVEVEGHFYSVPHQLVGKKLEVRFTDHTVECFHQGERVASHRRSQRKGGFSTVLAHMPRSHREQAMWTPERLKHWALKIGEATAKLAEGIMSRRAHPQQGYRACLGTIRLAERFGPDRVEAASRRALALGSFSYKSMESILKKGLDQAPLPPVTEHDPILHANIRGASYLLPLKQGGVSHAE